MEETQGVESPQTSGKAEAKARKGETRLFITKIEKDIEDLNLALDILPPPTTTTEEKVKTETEETMDNTQKKEGREEIEEATMNNIPEILKEKVTDLPARKEKTGVNQQR